VAATAVFSFPLEPC